MKSIKYPVKYFDQIAHSIEGQSFSANIEIKTIEAMIIQDEEPFCISRSPNDAEFTMDHFYKKLFKAADTLKAKSVGDECIQRVEGKQLILKSLDAVDGIPVLDIKPWVKEFGPRGEVIKPDWISELMTGFWG